MRSVLVVVLVAACSRPSPQASQSLGATDDAGIDAAACATDNDCLGSAWGCQIHSCDNGECKTTNTPAGDPIDDTSITVCAAGTCDGSGNPVWTYAPDGTPCGPNNAICVQSGCYTPGIGLGVSGDEEARVLDADGHELGRCSEPCLIPLPAGHYRVEAASPWGRVGLSAFYTDGSVCENSSSQHAYCDVDLDAVEFTKGVTASIYQQPDTWDFRGDACEVFRSAAFDPAGNLLVGSSQHLRKLDRTGALVWSLDVPVASLVAPGADAIYVLSGDQLLKLDQTGTLLWQRAADTCPTAEFANCLAVSQGGDVIFGGPRAIRWAPDGTQRWSVPREPTWTASSVAVTYDDVTDVLQRTTSGALTAARIAADGTRLSDFEDVLDGSLGDANPVITDNGYDLVVMSSHDPYITVREFASNGHPVKTYSVASPGGFGVATSTGLTSVAFDGLYTDATLGYLAQQLGGLYEVTGHSLGDSAAIGMAGEIGVTIHGVAISPVDGRTAVVGEYHGLAGATTAWLAVSGPTF